MRAVVIEKFGPPEVLEVKEVADPQPGPNEVLIKVAYAGVNYGEAYQRWGRAAAHMRAHATTMNNPFVFPFIPGHEVSGYIQAVGEGVKNLEVGQPVAAYVRVGGYAELVVANALFTFPLNDGPDLKTAAAILTVGVVAYGTLIERAHLVAGETLMVHAAAGGLGTIAGQLAKHLHAARIIGVVSQPAKIAYAQSFGYDTVYLYDEVIERVLETTAGRGVDVILDSVGGEVLRRSSRVLASSGRLVCIGDASNSQDVTWSTGTLTLSNHSICGFSIGLLSVREPARYAAIAQQVLNLTRSGILHFAITDEIPLNEARKSHELIEDRHHMGKIVLAV